MTVRRTYFDLDLDATDHPERGDVMLGPNNAYRVVDVWPTESRQWANRWTITWEPLGAVRSDSAGRKVPPLPDPGGRHWHFVNGGRS